MYMPDGAALRSSEVARLPSYLSDSVLELFVYIALISVEANRKLDWLTA